MDKDRHTQPLWAKYLGAFLALELLDKKEKQTNLWQTITVGNI